VADPTVPQVVRSYLAKLDRSLIGLPSDVRDEIMAGIREELDGLDAGSAAARIQALGDPQFIAAEARAEAAVSPSAGALDVGQAEPRWYPVLASLLVAFGGIVIPVVGWIVGIVMVWLSATWTRGEKWVATLTPFVAVVAASLIITVSLLGGEGSSASAPTGADTDLHVPVSVSANPLLPTAYDLVWSGATLFLFSSVIVGIWLLWRARRAWSAATAVTAPQPVTRPQASWYPVVTVLLIAGGGYVVPVIGWVAGVTMLWLGDRWTNRDKWIGSVAGPLASLAVLGFSAATQLGAPDGLIGWHSTMLGVLVAPLTANVLVGIRLLRRTGASGGASAPSGG
jgi:uncharacterized membrane protein